MTMNQEILQWWSPPSWTNHDSPMCFFSQMSRCLQHPPDPASSSWRLAPHPRWNPSPHQCQRNSHQSCGPAGRCGGGLQQLENNHEMTINQQLISKFQLLNQIKLMEYWWTLPVKHDCKHHSENNTFPAWFPESTWLQSCNRILRKPRSVAIVQKYTLWKKNRADPCGELGLLFLPQPAGKAETARAGYGFECFWLSNPPGCYGCFFGHVCHARDNLNRIYIDRYRVTDAYIYIHAYIIIFYLISRGMKSMFSDDSARVGTYETFYGYGTVGTVGTVRWVRWVRYGGYGGYGTVGIQWVRYGGYGGTVRCVRWVRYGGYGTVGNLGVPYPPYPRYRTHCTHRTVPPYPTYRTLHRTIIFEDRTSPQSITLEIW